MYGRQPPSLFRFTRRVSPIKVLAMTQLRSLKCMYSPNVVLNVQVHQVLYDIAHMLLQPFGSSNNYQLQVPMDNYAFCPLLYDEHSTQCFGCPMEEFHYSTSFHSVLRLSYFHALSGRQPQVAMLNDGALELFELQPLLLMTVMAHAPIGCYVSFPILKFAKTVAYTRDLVNKNCELVTAHEDMSNLLTLLGQSIIQFPRFQETSACQVYTGTEDIMICVPWQKLVCIVSNEYFDLSLEIFWGGQPITPSGETFNYYFAITLYHSRPLLHEREVYGLMTFHVNLPPHKSSLKTISFNALHGHKPLSLALHNKVFVACTIIIALVDIFWSRDFILLSFTQKFIAVPNQRTQMKSA